MLGEHIEKTEKVRWLLAEHAGAFISTGSSSDLHYVPAESVDYVFVDPPFGSNLMYSELNFIWES